MVFRDLVRVARLLNDLVIGKSIYDLIKLGWNPTTLYRVLRELVEYGFVRVTTYGGVRHYHLTGLGAEYLKILRLAIARKVCRELEKRGIKYTIWYGDNEVRATAPVIYVERKTDIPLNTEGLVKIEVRPDVANHREE
ncbi:MAG TPA: hypothetical protein ENF75_02905 [Acidilobales archaeon]|nr:hypothetical protein [Acidilobales archaeon]